MKVKGSVFFKCFVSPGPKCAIYKDGEYAVSHLTLITVLTSFRDNSRDRVCSE